MTAVDDKLAQLLEILAHEHTDKCFHEYLEDCGEHHAHSRACLTRRTLVCTITERYLLLIISRATPALVALARAAAPLSAATGGHLYKCDSDYGMVCDCPVPAIDAALATLAETDIRW